MNQQGTSRQHMPKPHTQIKCTSTKASQPSCHIHSANPPSPSSPSCQACHHTISPSMPPHHLAKHATTPSCHHTILPSMPPHHLATTPSCQAYLQAAATIIQPFVTPAHAKPTYTNQIQADQSEPTIMPYTLC